jgi:hypothetical protein
MWWPALGALAVGVVGVIEPLTLGVGYDNIERILSGELAVRAILLLCGLKFVSWALALGSGTSGGTLAPLFTVGGGLGAVLAMIVAPLFPEAHVDPRIGALVGMASMFAGASRALLASVVFAFETTRQPMGLLPLLGGATAAFLMSCLWMRHSIMTEKIARRGVRVTGEYGVDPLAELSVSDAAFGPVTLEATTLLEETRSRLARDSAADCLLVLRGGEAIGLVNASHVARSLDPPTTAISTLVKERPRAIASTASLRDAVLQMHKAKVEELLVRAVPDEHGAVKPGFQVVSARSVLDAIAARALHERVVERTLAVKVPRVR